MRQLNDFVCQSCGTQQERFLDTDVDQVACKCGEMATRVIGMPQVKLDGTDPSFPGAYDRWAKIREDNARIKAKRQ